MAGKSKHKRGKHSPRTKKGKIKRQIAAATTQQAAVAETRQPVSQPGIPAPSLSAPSPLAKHTAAQYNYISAELRTFGILAGAMLIILIVLSFVLS